jgi:hypothetical protein
METAQRPGCGATSRPPRLNRLPDGNRVSNETYFSDWEIRWMQKPRRVFKKSATANEVTRQLPLAHSTSGGLRTAA